MNFLNPFFLIGSALLAVPVLIHLVRRERSEVVPFSSLMFLLKIPKRVIRQQMLKNILLMALRLLLIALLVGIFARPYLVQSATPNAAQSGQGRGFVMLLDNSYSMRYGTNFSQLKSEALSRINGLSGNDRMAIVVFNEGAEVPFNPTTDKGKLRAVVDTLEPSFSGTRFFEAFSMADRLLSQFGAQEKNLIMISDFQRTGWNRSSRESVIGRDVKVDMKFVGVEKSNNVGIDNVSVEATSFVRTYNGRIVARIHNYNPDKEVSVPVSLTINDKEVAKKTVVVPASGASLAEFAGGFELDLGFAKGKVKILMDDPLPLDNEYLFGIERREKLNVLILDSGQPRQSFHLKTAFSATSDLPFSVKVGNASAVTVEELGSQDIVIFNDVPRLSDAARDRMVQARKSGQGQLVVLGPKADLSWWGSIEGFPAKPVRKVDVATAERGKSVVYLTSYDRNHGIFKPFQGTSRLGLNTAQFRNYVELQLNPGASAIGKFDNGQPAVVESSLENRGLLVFASTLDNTWNDLPLKPSFVLFLHQSARYLTGYNAVKSSYTLGEGIPIIGALEGGVVRVVDPGGTQVSLGELKSGEQRYYSPTAPGFYELRVGRDTRLLAVNPPSSEGNLEKMLPEDLLASVQSTEAEARQAGNFTTDDRLEYARQQMGWWYLLIIALIAGVVELYIANSRTQSVRRIG
jgi:hypothetical protein